ncbi:DEAD/DEAH box helicase [Extensimonas vulgaris]|uniref:Superfamily II DNA/RNA helicase n=1 Tax=Extensimonas vulgaris TaxID=1031594 RepID=A0A369AWH1_9BURK|nr:DEAD/DEAH box helicase [Extensimonas vulgaris]RCX11804.1 superfamily II DNA/RNA helicase [Extensimonas vulgaris]TWI40697.1 superfamily II DNA/RNA helicase [Extensimonas vulgaris]TXD15354.1 DEAD/DEAH box helicase [Extensimonas vulgaris]
MTDTSQVRGEHAPVSPISAPVSPSAAALASESTPENGFAALGLAPELLQAVAELGYTAPTAVQQKTIPLAMGNGAAAMGFIDLMVSSQTGSGKTAAFLLPVLHTLLRQQAEARAAQERTAADAAHTAAARGEDAPRRAKRKNPTDPRNFKAATPGALVLCPTRELAQQVANDAIDLVKHCRGLRVASVVGGMPYQMQIARLQNANLVVATPGRLLDLQRSQQLKLDQVQFLVVDEADRMLDLGFADDLAEIHQLTAQRRQTMMFSATFAPRIQQLALRVMHDGGASMQKVQIDTPQEKHANIEQKLYWADNAQHKRQLLDHWLRHPAIEQAIVFASTQIECDGLANDLQQEGFSAVALHGALSQGLRNRRLMALRKGQVQILVATDVAARGIDVPSITHVFNFGLPMKAEDYTHRIGRTGRAGRDGLAVTFAEFRDRRKIFDIENYSRQPFQAAVIPGLEPTQRAPQAGRSFGGKGQEGRRGGASGGRAREGSGYGGGRGKRSDFARDDFAPRSFGPRRDGEGYGRKSGFGDFSGSRPAAAPGGAGRGKAFVPHAARESHKRAAR